jgi:hypothetical protein
MRNFYASSQPMPLDQADGLRRLFAGRRCQVLALVANPHVPFGGLVLDRLAQVMAAQGRQVLVVDAASTSPQPHELAAVDLSACIEPVAPGVRYLPAKGLPLHHVDTRGRSGAFIDAVQQAAQQSTPAGSPATDVVLLHADAADLARLLPRQRTDQAAHRAAYQAAYPVLHAPEQTEPSIRPMLLGADHPESVKHAYASAKLLAQRCGLTSFDLLLVAAAHSPRADSISHSLADCVEKFLDGEVRSTVLIDPAVTAPATPAQRQATDASLLRLLAAQLNTEDDATEHPMTTAFAPHNANFAPEDEGGWVPPRRPSHAAVRAAAQRNTQPIAEHGADHNLQRPAQHSAQHSAQHIDRGHRARSDLSSSTAF